MGIIIQKLSLVSLTFFLCSNLAGCEAGQVAQAPQVITADGQQISIEVAVTAQEQAQGLMWRESMNDDAGMLFVYGSEAPRSFWMKNTLIPLDILYIDKNHTIVDIQTMQPCPADADRCPSYPSAAPAQYALEINAGKAAEWGLEVGDRLDISY